MSSSGQTHKGTADDTVKTVDHQVNGIPSSKSSSQHELAVLMKTVCFASLKHSSQRRKDPEKTPYINHPVGVANILASEGGVVELKVLQAAVLHDTVEDTDTSLEELEEVFGKDVRNIVAEVTDDKVLPYDERKRQQILKAPKVSREAKLVKLADKLHNLRDLVRVKPEGWNDERRQHYFIWAGKVIEGLLGTNATLEDELRQILAQQGVILPAERSKQSETK